MLIEYNSNNSGGDWWLKDGDWKNLEKNGWKVIWCSEEFVYEKGRHVYDENGLPKTKNEPNTFSKKDKNGIYRYLGALAHYAFKHFDSIKEALQEFEKITGQDVSEEGCNCCGPPHCFSWEGDCCSGEECLQYLFDNVPSSLRDACSNEGD